MSSAIIKGGIIMQFTISTGYKTYLFEIDEAHEGWFWALYDNDKIYCESSDFFQSEYEAQQDAIKWVREHEEQQEAANDARGEERAGEWEYNNSRL